MRNNVQSGVVVLALVVEWVASASCISDKQLAASYGAALLAPLSPACVGQWSDMTTPVHAATFTVLTRTDKVFACALTACRKDFSTAAASLKSVNCDEAQADSERLTRLLKYCEGLTLPLSLPRCSQEQNRADLGTVFPTECGPVNATRVEEFISSTVLYKAGGVCRAPCVAALEAKIKADLPDCRSALIGLPVSKKQLYLNDLAAFCGPLTQPSVAANDFSSCDAKLAELYATPFSNACNAALVGTPYHSPTKATNHVLFESLYGQYMLTYKVIASKSSCAAEVAALEARLDTIGPCAANVLFGFQVLKLAHTTNATTAAPSTLALCTKSQNNLVTEALTGKAPAVCMQNNPSVLLWSDVFSTPLPDIASIAAAPGCVAAAVEFATKSLPTCQAYYPESNGVTAVAQMTRYLLAAQTLVSKGANASSATTTPSAKTSSAAPSSPFLYSGGGVMLALISMAVVAAV